MKATVLLPTTAGRGALIRYSAGSVLRQTIRDLELFIVGDGVDEETRIVARELCEHDSRVRFVDRPKHARRGETYRHELLTSEASGDIVCYLCDRDLMLSNHVAESLRNLESYDFSGTGIYMMQVDGSIKAATINLLGEIQGDDRMRFGQLSRNAHTLRAYKSLPHGWRTTPEEEGTDCHMWNQFMSEPDIRANVLATPTILYFKQMERRHWPIEKRCAELEDWFNRLNSDGGELKIHREGARTLYTENYHLKRQVNALSKALRRPLNIRGKSPAEAVRLLAVKAFNRRRPG